MKAGLLPHRTLCGFVCRERIENKGRCIFTILWFNVDLIHPGQKVSDKEGYYCNERCGSNGFFFFPRYFFLRATRQHVKHNFQQTYLVTFVSRKRGDGRGKGIRSTYLGFLRITCFGGNPSIRINAWKNLLHNRIVQAEREDEVIEK